MNTQNHSGRFRRLSNTTDLRDRTFNADESKMSETIKLPALNAIMKSVKYNDLSYATTRDLNKLRKEPDAAEDLEKGAAHNILMAVRKKYDQISKAREEKEDKIEQLKVEKHKFQSQKGLYAGEKGEGEKKVNRLQEGLKEVKGLVQSCDIEKKVMMNMVARLKADKVVYDQRKFNLQKQLSFLKKQKQIIELSKISLSEEEDRTQKIYQKLLEHLEEENMEREAHISNLNRMIEEKVMVNESTEMRQTEMKEIAENALQDKDGKEKNWRKVYLCHRFVEKLLRDKMNRQMVKFNVVQTAFKNIKMVTGVSNGETLVKKFLNKEKAYGELLGKIAQNQRHILDLKAETQSMNKETTMLRAESQILSVNKKESKDLTKEEKQFHFISQKSQNCSLYAQRLKSWLLKILRRYSHLDKRQAQQLQSRQRLGDITDLFKEYAGQISTTLDEAKDTEISDYSVKSTSSGGTNVRVNLEDESVDVRQPILIDNDEEDFLNHQRQDLLRNNEKFMKDVRKKYEEEKKLKIESEPKKKDPSPEKPKPPPESA